MTPNDDMIELSSSPIGRGRRARSLEELLSWNDLEFVRSAYLTLFGRQADEDGEVVYLNLVRSGRPKLYIIGKLRRSPEGRKCDPAIAGLDRAVRRQRRAMLPIVGKLIARLTHAESDSRADRLRRSVENRASLMQEAMALHNRRLTTLEGRMGASGPQGEKTLASRAPGIGDRRMSPRTNEFYEILSSEDIRTFD